jgi:hypothetical protein
VRVGHGSGSHEASAGKSREMHFDVSERI